VVRALSLLERRQDPGETYRELAHDCDLDLDARSTWLLFRLDRIAEADLSEFAGRYDMTAEQVYGLIEPLERAGYVSVEKAGGSPRYASLTADGVVAIERLVAARQARLTARLGTWSEEMDAQLAEKLRELARDLLCDPSRRAALLANQPLPSAR
jgi:DNA-binding MarR family transcriptional regulator